MILKIILALVIIWILAKLFAPISIGIISLLERLLIDLPEKHRWM